MKEELKKAKIVPVVKLEEYEKAELLAKGRDKLCGNHFSRKRS